MKLAVSALFAFAMLAGGSGCHCFYHRPLLGGCCIDECAGDCGDCGGGCGRQACGCNVGPFGGCGGMGCSRRLHVFNWSRCRDCCDLCGHWTGEGFVSQSGGFHPVSEDEMNASYDGAASYEEPSTYYEEPRAAKPESEEPAPEELMPNEPSARVVPGSMRVTTRSADDASEEINEEPVVAARPRPIPAAPRRAKRISSTRTK